MQGRSRGMASPIKQETPGTLTDAKGPKADLDNPENIVESTES